MIRFLFPLLLMLAAAPAHAWWNGDWSARKAITVNTADSGAAVKEAQTNVPVLIRLHTGNFDFLSANPNGSDLRFVAGDDKTPLNFQIEKFDSTAEQALIWVQVPKVEGGKDKPAAEKPKRGRKPKGPVEEDAPPASDPDDPGASDADMVDGADDFGSNDGIEEAVRIVIRW